MKVSFCAILARRLYLNGGKRISIFQKKKKSGKAGEKKTVTLLASMHKHKTKSSDIPTPTFYSKFLHFLFEIKIKKR